MATTDTYTLLRAFVDELARCGMTDACTSPGSRCTPLVVSLVGDGRLRCHSHIDERCGGFFALGMAKATGRPVAITCTSGTAAAEFAPAVIEAHEARVPLIVLTADRPPELRDVGAGQAIDQLKLYGSAAKWFVEVDTAEATVERLRWMRALACRAYWTAAGGRPGPVHLNFPLREPLVLEGELEPDESARPNGGPWISRQPRHDDTAPAADTLTRVLDGASQPVIVAGRYERGDALGPALAQYATEAGVPLLADPLSGARRGPTAIARYGELLRDELFAGRHQPDAVIRVGDLPTSKWLRAWLAGVPGMAQIAIDPESAWQDPAAVVGMSLDCDPVRLFSRLEKPKRSRARDDWLAAWRAADDVAAAAIVTELGEDLSEPRVAALLGERLPAGATLFVASSMPIRDVEGFWPARDDAPRVLSNRGANGIDGTVSSAFGVAAVGDGPVVLLIGDVALAHDIGGLLAAKRLGLKLTIVVLNNDGGGIFDFLPVSAVHGVYEQHVATPHGLDFAQAAALYGVEHERVADVAGLADALDRALPAPATTIIEVPSGRAVNVAVHERVIDAVAAALEAQRSG